jgi:GAF domain-containing protein
VSNEVSRTTAGPDTLEALRPELARLCRGQWVRKWLQVSRFADKSETRTQRSKRMPLHFLMRKNLARLDELRRCLVLESSAEQAYDDITRLLATSLGVPMVMVSLLDEDRDWFKSTIGTPLHASPASTSFCEVFFHSGQDTILAEDTRLDPRFAAHPLVIGAPHIRFYAAARLEVNGQTVGTLCAYDFQPHQVSAQQIAQLRTLAESAMDLLRRRLISRAG